MKRINTLDVRLDRSAAPAPERRIGTPLFLLLAAALCLAAPHAAAQSRRRVECRQCMDTGLVPCEEHGAAREWCGANSFFCSECELEFPCCRGRGLRPCDCVDRDWENLVLDAGYEIFEGAMEARRGLVEFMKADPIYISTEHFFVMSTLDGIKLAPGEAKDIAEDLAFLKRTFPWLVKNPLVLSPHAMAHLYAWRLERVYIRYREALGLSEEEDRAIPYSGRQVEVFLCGRAGEQNAWKAKHGGAAIVSGSSWKFSSPLSTGP